MLLGSVFDSSGLAFGVLALWGVLYVWLKLRER